MHYYFCDTEHKFLSCDSRTHGGCQNQPPSPSQEIFAFIDESERANTHYFMGAIVASAQQIIEISDKMDSIMGEYSQVVPVLTPDTEFHGSEMMNGKGVWKDVPLRIKFAMFRKVFDAIYQSGARVFVEGIHHAALHPAANKQMSPRERAFSHLFEQINYYGYEQNQVHIIADEHHTATTSRSNFSRYRTQGTYGYKSNKLQGIDPDLEFIASTESRLLQAADMTTYIYNRLETIEESNPKAQKFKRDLWDTFNHSIYTPSRGRGRIWP
ncbi:DUF3800 domain-containing protein [Rothia sp. L_38]|uniref:DUF3800 domain-containing protein n=1 Tax=Rothia sp. L_38 TaxID=3422315 RepID=UPI003D6AE82D